MREWILENTTITEEEYNKLINPYMINMLDSKPDNISYTPCKLFSHPLIAIDRFTIKKPNILNKIRYRIISEKNYYIHQKVKFYILAKLIKEMEEILYSPKRNNKCGELSLEVAARLKENCYVITAICIDPFNEEHKPFLHTFVTLTNKKENEYCIDATLNAIFKKEVYFELFKPTIISIISKDTLTKDLNILNQANIPRLTLAEYLCFPNKVMDTAKKLTRTKK